MKHSAVTIVLLEVDSCGSLNWSYWALALRFLFVDKLQGRSGGDTPLTVFLIFLVDDKSSAPKVFCSCSFILCVYFETSSVMAVTMVTRYDGVISSRWSSYFWVNSNYFNLKSLLDEITNYSHCYLLNLSVRNVSQEFSGFRNLKQF